MDWAKYNLELDGNLVRPLAWKQHGWLLAGFSTRQAGNLSYRHGDDQEVLENRKNLAAKLGLTINQLIAMQQVHGNHIEIAGPEDVGKGALRFESGFEGTDGMINQAPVTLSMALVADCVPILMIDPVTKNVGVFHAGRKGTELGIATEGVKAMVAAGSQASDLEAVLGPSIGPCHYETDLWAANENQLKAAGVTKVIRTDICTAEHLDVFFSHRAEDGDTGRFAGFIGTH